MTGIILETAHFSVHDGPGIRSVVFLKGCPLRCLWCHTPESQSGALELRYQEERCLHCGSCRRLYQQLPLSGLSTEQCQLAASCPVNALKTAGRTVSAAEVISEIESQRIFFLESGGGMTISGGEPLFQADFSLKLLQLAAERNISSCIETCGFGDFEHLLRFLPYTEIFLFDCKATDSTLHRKLTGVDNRKISDNLRRLSAAGGRIHLRCPLVPGINDQPEHLLKIAALAEELSGIEAIHIEPYHPMARGKYAELQRPFAHLPSEFPTEEQIQTWVRTISAHTAKPVELP